MRMPTRPAVLLGLFALLSGSAFAAGRPNLDAFGSRPPVAGRDAGLRASAAGLAKPGAPFQTESRLGVPTFLWLEPGRAAALASLGSGGAGPEKPEIAAARAALGAAAPLYGLSAADVEGASLVMVHNTGKGAIVVKFHQRVGGVDVFREEVNVVLDRALVPVAISGYISSATTPAAQGGSTSFVLSAAAAASRALNDMTGVSVSASQLAAAGSRGGYDTFTLASGAAVLDEPIRTRKVFYHLPEGLEAAYYVEVLARVPDAADVASLDGSAVASEGYAYVVSAVSGQTLFRKNLTADAGGPQTGGASLVNPGGFTYRVWADPVSGTPFDTPAGNAVHPKATPTPDGFQATYVPSVDVTLSNIVFSHNDPWLAPGATETVGNNADAFVNLTSPDGYGPIAAAPYSGTSSTGDFRAQITAAGEFKHTHVADSVDPTTAEQRQGAIQQLFYDVNFLHDWYYDAGFDEASLNAQTDNFGRGGLGNDSIRAQADDFSGRNNANMQTPADGTRPRMRMYIFDTNAIKYVDVLSPASIAGQRSVGTGQFGAQVFDLTNTIVQPATAAGCTAGDYAAVAGKFVMVNREPTSGAGACSIGTKLNNAMAAGAAGFILVNLSTTPDTLVTVTGSLPSFTIPFVSITWNGAAGIKTELAVPNVVTARLRRDAGIDRDGTIDNQIVFHEWAHFLSNRLVGNASGLVSQMSAGMGEGWGDFNAMMLTVRPDDTSTPSNATWNGVYALATYATSGGPNLGPNQGYYFGIRRYPYSTDMTKNPLTFRHISEGQPLPAGPPVAFGASGVGNSEVHNTGEVWTSMLWECYAALLRDTQGPSPRLTFADAQDRMKTYLVASLKATPGAPTFTEARDAVLAAAYATDVVDYLEFWQAFAKRGIGYGAVSPDRFVSDNSPVTESFTVIGPDLAFTGATLDDGVASCDADGVLDSGETGHLVVTLRNVGTTTLSATSGTVTPLTAGVSIVGSPNLSFSPSGPLGTTTASVVVALGPGIAGIQQLDFKVDFTDPQLSGGPRTTNTGVRANTNAIPASTATDTVEAVGTTWTVSANPFFVFGPTARFSRKEVTPLQHVWHVADPSTGSDEYLTSPLFTVDGSGSLNVQFDHSFVFEADAGGNYDGAVVEVSVNGGAFVDLSAAAYNGTILNYSGDVNPLKGRPGFVGSSGGTIHTSLTTAVAPGSTAQVRFRFASDASGEAGGWDIDNISFAGVVETPFTTLVADTGCALPTTTTLTPSANPSPFGNTLTLTAAVSASTGAVNAGSVTFFDGATPIGDATVVSGVATFGTASLAQGVHVLKAQFGGAPGFAASTSNTVNESIGKPAATVALGTSQSPSALAQSVTFTATVSALSGTPTGSVSFADGVSPLATVALSGGVATFTTSALAGGSHTIVATYNGNSTYDSALGSVTQVVAIPTVNASGPTTFCAGGSVTLTASIPPGAGVTYSWSPGGQTTPAIVVTAPGNYAVTVAVNGVPGTSLATAVTVNAVPGLPVITAPASTLPGTTGLVASVPSNAGSTYAWTITNGSITGGNGTNQITFTAGVSGPLGLTVVETNASNCASAQASATVSVAAVSYALHTTTPCRLLDTRNASGPDAGAPALAAFEARVVAIGGRCGIPSSAKALSVNLTAIAGLAAGYVAVYPADLIQAVPVGVSSSFRAGRTRAVNGILLLASDGSGFKAHNTAAGTVDIVVDVNGWFE